MRRSTFFWLFWIGIGAGTVSLVAILDRPFNATTYSKMQSKPSALEENLPGAALLSIPQPLSDFELIDDMGNNFTRINLEGYWTTLFFGYTHCPDICPITLQTLSDAIPLFDKEDSEEIPRILFVSVDPEHDKAGKLREYVDFFHPSISGITGDSSAILAFALDVGATFKKHENETIEDPLFSHSSSLFLIDPKGRLAAIIDPPREPQEFIETLKRVRELL